MDRRQTEGNSLSHFYGVTWKKFSYPISSKNDIFVAVEINAMTALYI